MKMKYINVIGVNCKLIFRVTLINFMKWQLYVC